MRTSFESKTYQALFSREPMEAGEERACGLRVRQGHADAARELAERNTRLAYTIARQHGYSSIPFEDILGAALEGLVEAAAKYDPDLGRFSVYAGFRIREAVMNYNATMSRGMRLPRGAVMRVAQLNAAVGKEGAGDLSADDLVKQFGWRRDSASAILQASGEQVSLDAEAGAGGRVLDFIADERCTSPAAAFDRADLMAELVKLIHTLDRKAARVIRGRFGLDTGEPRTLAEIAAELKVTRERVRQIEFQALRDLRAAWHRGEAMAQLNAA